MSHPPPWTSIQDISSSVALYQSPDRRVISLGVGGVRTEEGDMVTEITGGRGRQRGWWVGLRYAVGAVAGVDAPRYESRGGLSSLQRVELRCCSSRHCPLPETMSVQR